MQLITILCSQHDRLSQTNDDAYRAFLVSPARSVSPFFCFPSCSSSSQVESASIFLSSVLASYSKNTLDYGKRLPGWILLGLTVEVETDFGAGQVVRSGRDRGSDALKFYEGLQSHFDGRLWALTSYVTVFCFLS